MQTPPTKMEKDKTKIKTKMHQKKKMQATSVLEFGVHGRSDVFDIPEVCQMPAY